MTSDQLESACIELFGESWKGTMADALEIDDSTRWRYLQGEELPNRVITAISAWLLLKRSVRVLPPKKPTDPFNMPLGEATDEMLSVKLESLAVEAEKLFGRKWKTPLCQALGVDSTTVWRYQKGQKMPGATIATLRAWILIKRLIGLSPPFKIDDFQPARLPLAEDAYRSRPDGAKGTKAAKYARLISSSDEEDD